MMLINSAESASAQIGNRRGREREREGGGRKSPPSRLNQGSRVKTAACVLIAAERVPVSYDCSMISMHQFD